VHRVISFGDGTGDPHGSDPDPALLRITVPEVLAAVDQVLTVVAAERQPQPAGRGSRS
jgi:hypothetical protein